jgi:DNA-binding transcriptional regulator YiaG
MKPPSKDDISIIRKASGLTQLEAANLIYKNLRTWQQWEAGDRAMDPAFWELFCIKIKQRQAP